MTPALRLEGVPLRAGGRTLTLDLSLSGGEVLVVVGRSGSGVSALLKLAAGVLRPEAGSVTLAGGEGGALPMVGFVGDLGGLVANLTLLENALLPAAYHRTLPPEEARRRGRALFSELGIPEQMNRRPAAVGVSARKLAQLGRALLCDPALFVLDEPLADIDHMAARTIRSALGRAREGGKAVLIGTADPGPYLDWGGGFLHLGRRAKGYRDKKALLASEDPDLRELL